MSKSIKTLQDSFKSTASLEHVSLELKKENKALKETVTKLLKEIDKISGVEKLKPVIDMSPELQIIEMQIMRLHADSMLRQLSFDETKTLDLHIKNKRLLEDKSTLNAEYTSLPSDITEEDLLRIAGAVGEEEPKKKKRPKSKSSG